MPKQKFEQFYDLMWENHSELLQSFKVVHDRYALGDKKSEPEFHAMGTRVLDKIREWDRRLCAGMSRGQFSQYSVKLSEKFWNRAREDFSLLDQIGVKVSSKTSS